MRSGRKEDMRIRNRGETRDPDGREREHRGARDRERKVENIQMFGRERG